MGQRGHLNKLIGKFESYIKSASIPLIFKRLLNCTVVGEKTTNLKQYPTALEKSNFQSDTHLLFTL